MIIDAHTHIYPQSVAQKALQTIIQNTGGKLQAYTDGTFENLCASMKTAGIDYSVVLAVATRPGHGGGTLRWIQSLLPQSENLLFFASLHPAEPHFQDLLKEIKASEIQGLKFHPAYQNFPVDSPEAYRVYEAAAKHDLILHFHAGFDMSLPHCDYTSVERFEQFLKDFQGAKIVLAHGGGHGQWQEVLERLSGRQCYFDIAFVLEEMKECSHARELYRQNEDYFIFGTDSPWRDQAHYVKLIRESKTLSSAQKEKMFAQNLLKLIRLP